MADSTPPNFTRRHFIGQAGVLVSGAIAIPSMPHVCLLGDSIFDNAAYVGGKPDVIAQVRSVLPSPWKATLLAVDGATTAGVDAQLKRLPAGATHLVLSVGGNDALRRADALSTPVKTAGGGLTSLAAIVQDFETDYRRTVEACLKPGLPLIVCTIYNGNFPDPAYQKQVTAALALYNDAILRTAVEKRLPAIDLRLVCNRPEDYANPIEPSAIGGDKIARTISRVLTTMPVPLHGSLVTGF